MQIFQQLIILKRNQYKVFNDIETFKGYKERDYIFSIRFNCKELFSNKDFPFRNLRVIEFGNVLEEIPGDVIPMGVTTIYYPEYTGDDKFKNTDLNRLPSSVTSVFNVVFKYSFNFIVSELLIPSNIKTISFLECSSISINGVTGTNIPSTVKTLIFKSFDGKLWNNDKMFIGPGDIPNGVENLYLENSTAKFKPNSLPNSIKFLSIRLFRNQDILKNFFPNSVSNLHIYGEDIEISSSEIPRRSLKSLSIFTKRSIFDSGLIPYTVENLLISNISNQIPNKLMERRKVSRLKKLELNFTNSSSMNEMEQISFQKFLFSLVFLEDLILGGFQTCLLAGTLPDGLKSLEFTTHYNHIFGNGVLPSTLTHLTLNDRYNFENYLQSIFPISLKTIVLPNHWTDQQKQDSKQNLIPNCILMFSKQKK
ncbi:hypothetical protein ACTA71_000652 [Dictyostelium dimigraforme]